METAVCAAFSPVSGSYPASGFEGATAQAANTRHNKHKSMPSGNIWRTDFIIVAAIVMKLHGDVNA
jgi:hypothetical protein